MSILNVAHRGLWNAALPQNTLEAFRRAWAAGATWVETDFHHTRAGQMVCIHVESELRLYAGCEKKIVDLTPEEVASIRLDPAKFAASATCAMPAPDAGDDLAAGTGGFRLPLLHEVLATVPPHGTLQAEIKDYSPTYADIFDDAVRAAGLSESNIVVSSFDFDALADFHARKPSYRTLWLVTIPSGRPFDAGAWLARCRGGGFWSFCPGCKTTVGTMAPADAEAIRAAGLSFRLWGVNSPEQLDRAAELGAEAFTCNFWREAFSWARERAIDLRA